MRLNGSALGVVIAALPAVVLSELVTKYAYPSTCSAIYTTVDASVSNIFTNGTAIFTSGSSTVTIAQPSSSSTALTDEALNSGDIPFVLQVQRDTASRKRQAERAIYIDAGGYTTTDTSRVARYLIHNGTLVGTSGGSVSVNVGVENMPFAISQTLHAISTRFAFQHLELHWNNTAFEIDIAGFFSVSASDGSSHIIVRFGGAIDSSWTPVKLVAVAAMGLVIQTSALTVGTTTASSTLSMGSMLAPTYPTGATTTQSRPTSAAVSSFGAIPSASGVSTVVITPVPATSPSASSSLFASSASSSSSATSSSVSTIAGYGSSISSPNLYVPSLSSSSQLQSSTTSSSSTTGLSSSTTPSPSSASSSADLSSAAVPIAPSSVQSVSPYTSATPSSTSSSSAAPVATGQVCSFTDGSTGIYPDSNGQCYQYYCGGIGEFDPDIAGTTRSESSFAECMQYCDTVSGCLAITFVSGTCYPKSSDTVNSGNAAVAMARKVSCPGASSSTSFAVASASAYSSTIASPDTSTTGYLRLPSPTACYFGDPPAWNEDDTYERIDLPQAMTIGGTSATDTYASTNGFISISAGSAQYQYERFPTTHLPAGTIAPYWADLYVYRRGVTGNAQGLFYQLNSTGISYEWYLSRAGQPELIYHFMVDYYYNTPGVFTYTYYEIGEGENGQFATVGMQSSTTSGYSYGFNVSGSVTPGSVVRCDTTAGTCAKLV